MKKTTILAAMLCLCFQAMAVLAATSDFSGEWILDVSRSKLPDTMPIKSMTLKVSQTANEISVETNAKRKSGASGGDVRGGAGGRTETYALDGRETTADVNRGAMKGVETRTAKLTTDGKLSLTAENSFKNGANEVLIKINETWELLDGGNTLKIIRYIETPRGGSNAEMYFMKSSAVKTLENAVVDREVNPPADSITSYSDPVEFGKKAKFLPKPKYPAAARAVKAMGAVNVQVTVDEDGRVTTADAVSGHPLLRQAAEKAAREAKFAPTLMEGKPVKVSGILSYYFIP